MANTNWLPGSPKTSNGSEYFRTKDLKTMPNNSCDLRVMCPFITGYEGWTQENKPVRAEQVADFPADISWRVERGSVQQPKPFWATVVYNREAKRLQVWSFTQATIYNQLNGLLDNKKWGALDSYDITITRKGEGTDTEYSVVPNPKEPIEAAVAEEWAALQERWVGLNALFAGGHPMQDFADAAF